MRSLRFGEFNAEDIIKRVEEERKIIPHAGVRLPSIKSNKVQALELPVLIGNQEWELDTPRNTFSYNPRLYYLESLKRLHAQGYERHANPAEQMDILMRREEGTLTTSQMLLAIRMSAEPEWTNISAQRHGDTLTLYANQELRYANDEWEKSPSVDIPRIELLSCSIGDAMEFPISAPLAVVPDILRECLWGRSFERLPACVRREARLLLPESDVWSVVIRGRDSPFDIRCYGGVKCRSRGVRWRANEHGDLS